MPDPLPVFEYFPDPLSNGCVIEKEAECVCCGQVREHMYVGPIYCSDDITEVCPWCISSGEAALKLSASFNDVYAVPNGVPRRIVEIIDRRTPGYETWQGNRWLFSDTDALIFVGEVNGAQILAEQNSEKIKACLDALRDRQFNWTAEKLGQIAIAGQPAVYLFQDRQTKTFAAYADYT